MSGNPDKLKGWGAIELHVGDGRRAILQAGYPIHYNRHTGRVHAFKSELDAHDRKQPLLSQNATDCRKAPQTAISPPA